MQEVSKSSRLDSRGSRGEREHIMRTAPVMNDAIARFSHSSEGHRTVPPPVKHSTGKTEIVTAPMTLYALCYVCIILLVGCVN